MKLLPEQEFIRVERARWAILFLLVSVALGVAVNGYRYAFSDQTLYIPQIERAVNPTLFPNDYLFDEPSGEYNFWIPAVSLLARFLPLEWLFFAGHLLTQLALAWAIYHLSLNLFGSPGAAALAVLFLIAPFDVGGTATATRDSFFTLRSTAMPFAVAFLIPYFRGRSVAAAVLCGVTFLIHPITALPVILLLAWRLVIDAGRGGWRTSAKASAVFLLCILPLLVRVLLIHRTQPSTASPFSRLDPEWLEMIRWRDGYIFLSLWDTTAFRSLLFFLVGLLAILWLRRRNTRREMDFWSLGVIVICLALFVVSLVFVEWYPLPLVVQLQVLRGFYLLVNLSMIYMAWLVWMAVQRPRRRWAKRLAAGVVTIGTIGIILLSQRGTAGQIDFPGQSPRSDWADVGRWCRDNTEVDATFLVPPEGVQGFRVHSRRGIVGNWKDGAPLVFSKDYANEWWARMEALWGYDAFDEARFSQLAVQYSASFAITRNKQELDLPLIYENSGFAVYALSAR